MRELRGVQLSLSELEAAGASVVVVSKDSPEELAKFAKSEQFGFMLLSDPDLKLVDEFGLRHPGADPIRGGDLARPAVLFFDATGVLRATFLTEDWRRRIHGEEALERLRALDAPR